MNLLLIGFGAVGQGFAEILHEKSARLQERGFAPRIIGVITATRGGLYRRDGLDIPALLAAAAAGSFAKYPQQAGLRRDVSAQGMIADGAADALLELSPTNLETAQPALDSCLAALEGGLHLVLANKGPVALAYPQLQRAAQARGRQLRFEATVMAGTPVLSLAQEALAGCAIVSARGILNGTTNYMLTRMEAGMSYEEALAQAQALGYAEADPAGDVEGWDAAGKALILAQALFGAPLRLTDLAVSGITQISAADIAEAKARGERIKLIAELSAAGGEVRARRLPISDPLAGVSGASNALTLETDLLGAVTIVGAGAGGRETGTALLNDLLAIARAENR